MYKTGDVGRWLAEGTVEYLGRDDLQVKVRGFRIELGDIEACLGGAEGISEAVVVAREEADGEKRLVAYYTGDSALNAEVLRAHLRERLPEYMVPAAYVRLEKLPLTPNGKLDRKALPAPEGDAYVTRGYEAPRGDVEEVLARLWSDLLKVGRVGRNDSFFELGGHSLLAVQLISRVWRELGVEITLRDLLLRPTPAGFAVAVSTVGSIARNPNIVPLRTSGDLDPIFVVHGLDGEVGFGRYLVESLDPRVPVYGLAATGFLSGEEPMTSLPQMAVRYAALIRQMHPHGPYRLVGYSAGGLIAYATAEALLETGAEVGFLGLLDANSSVDGLSRLSNEIDDGRGTGRDETAMFNHLLQEFLLDKDRPQLEALAARGDVVAMRDCFNGLGELKIELEAEALRRMLRVHMTILEAVVRYRPSPRSLSATLFRTSARGLSSMGWDDLLGRELRTVAITGDHFTIFQAPHVELLGKAIMKALKT
jgi:thioesterase domain-containing protein